MCLLGPADSGGPPTYATYVRCYLRAAAVPSYVVAEASRPVLRGRVIRLRNASGKDLGRGLFRLGKEFDHIEMAVMPHNDVQSLYTTQVGQTLGWGVR